MITQNMHSHLTYSNGVLSGHEKQTGKVLFYILDNISFFLDQYVTCYCLNIGPATLGHYLEFQPPVSGNLEILRNMIYLKYDKINSQGQI